MKDILKLFDSSLSELTLLIDSLERVVNFPNLNHK